MECGGGKKWGGNRDRLSNLPDTILLDILSRLPLTKDAAQTSVLSKRWRPLWTQLDRISLCFSCSGSCGTILRPSVARVITSLMQHASPRVTRLHIAMDTTFFPLEECENTPNALSEYLDHQIEPLLGFAWRNRVEVFSFDCSVSRSPQDFCKFPEPFYVFPRGFYPCSSVREFKTVGFDFEDTLNCSELRVLDIGLSNLSSRNYLDDVLSRCPLLESLRLFCCKLSRVDIMSTGLKKLAIIDVRDYKKAPNVRVSAPLLEHLELVSRKCMGTSYLLIDVPSLVVADIDLHPKFCETATPIEFRRIIEGVSHAKELRMGTWFVKALSTRQMLVNFLPAFSCKCLVVNLEKSDYYAYPGVKSLLQCLSMVEKLVLNFTEYGDGGIRQKFVSQLHTAFDHSNHYLKIIHVHGLHDSLENLYILEFLLKRTKALQEMVIHEIQSKKTLNKLIFAKKLVDLPKSSPAVVVRLPDDVDEEELSSL